MFWRCVTTGTLAVNPKPFAMSRVVAGSVSGLGQLGGPGDGPRDAAGRIPYGKGGMTVLPKPESTEAMVAGVDTMDDG